MKPLRLLLVDDHAVVRMGLRYVLEDVPNIALVGEASTADGAVAQCQSLLPDVVVMDIRMPGRSGIDACREITTRWPAVAVIMLTSFAEDELIVEAIRAGASGYILKDVSPVELIKQLNAVREGNAVLDQAATQQLISAVRTPKRGADPFEGLSPRERDVLYYMSLGSTNREIATRLSLSEKTIRNVVSIVLSKLDVSNRVEAALYATKHRIQDEYDAEP